MKKKNRDHLICVVDHKPATHSIVLEIREKPGPPIGTKVIHLACEHHAKNTNIDYWFDRGEWFKIVDDWNKKGAKILKQFCSINAVKLDL